jgi:hypothetical protein
LAEAIEGAWARPDFAPWAFVFMPEHAHILVWPRRAEYDISGLLGAINEPVGRMAIKTPAWTAIAGRRGYWASAIRRATASRSSIAGR